MLQLNNLLFFMWVGSDQRKKWLHTGTDPDHIADTKKNIEVPEMNSGGVLCITSAPLLIIKLFPSCLLQ